MNPFIKKYENKPAKELRQIVSNSEDYASEAVEAARHCLKERDTLKEALDVSENIEELENLNARHEVDSLLILKSFSAKELLTTYLALSMFFWGVLDVLSYYYDEPIINNNYNILLSVVFVLTYLGNHVFFRVEKKRSNTYTGRVINSFLFIAIFVLYRILFEAIFTNIQSSFSADIGTLIFGFVSVILSIMLVELIISLFNQILSFLRCPEL